ncbi:hypothetical protein [Fundicoccus culcitae]|uniref:Uncharacterized protein n=1 Tax=Fundicoccus culcitae TaxID=2969821 RepID=A0ABY5P9I2_9LACT|nr:hypothetical protein [Fundicoccus culcitae]UUX35422.1 hypothetical protein NRE15_07195 [Fundicoccus culcitae]
MPDLIPQRRPPNLLAGRQMKMSSAFLTCFIENYLIHHLAGFLSATTSAKPTCRTSDENVVRLFDFFIENKLILPIAGSLFATTSAKPTCRTSDENVVRLFDFFIENNHIRTLAGSLFATSSAFST